MSRSKSKKTIELKNLKAMIRDRAPSLDKIKAALGFVKLGRKRNTDGLSIETIPFDDGKVRRWLRHSRFLERRRNRGLAEPGYSSKGDC